jgi:MoaA/NifB/PqqE/SkfB family radical SAM enzyme
MVTNHLDRNNEIGLSNGVTLMSKELYAVIFKDSYPQEGFYDPETDDLGPFVWAQKNFAVRPQRGRDLFLVRMCHLGHKGTLSLERGGKEIADVALAYGWNSYILDLTDANGGTVVFHVSSIVPVPGDARELGLMIREFAPLENKDLHEEIQQVSSNKVKNQREFENGKIRLYSHPPLLRVNIEDRCNLKPRCAYCEWEWVKRAEKYCNAKFNLQMVGELGQFYNCAEEVVDCSYGEPLLNENFGSIVEAIHESGKHFELTSNAQLLGPEIRATLLGRPMYYYASVDAATSKGYRRYRNDKFQLVIDNLSALCREKREHNDLPKVFVSFIAMRSNLHEFPMFLDLMKRVGVDGVKLRSLDLHPNMESTLVDRNGIKFDYLQEILGMEQMDSFVERAKMMAEEKGLRCLLDSDFEEQQAAMGGPLCSEPWKTIYVLGRGIMPCCFARAPVARWSEQGTRSLEEFLDDVWNSAPYKEIRFDLASGRLSNFCFSQTSCPIVRRKKSR